MSTVLGYGLLFVACWCVAAAIVSPALGLALRGHRRSSRPAHPHAPGAGRVRPGSTARGRHAASSAYRRPRHAASSLPALRPVGEDGPAAGDAAGPTNLATP